VDGLRLDTTKEVQKHFFPDFVSAAGVFVTGEVDDGDANVICSYQNDLGSVLNYPT
jgi:alpha-amylase